MQGRCGVSGGKVRMRRLQSWSGDLASFVVRGCSRGIFLRLRNFFCLQSLTEDVLQGVQVPSLPDNITSSLYPSSDPSSSSSSSQPHPPPPPSASQDLEGLWSLANPMAFENIAFSRATDLAPASDVQVSRFLGCGACEAGPLGYVTEGPVHGPGGAEAGGRGGEKMELGEAVRREDATGGGRGFWIVPDRVRYRVG